MALYYHCPDSPKPFGGIRVIYRHVDILNRNGIEAFVLHERAPFRCTWFENETAIAYLTPPDRSPSKPPRVLQRVRRRFHVQGRRPTNESSPPMDAGDVLVIPEVMALREVGRTRGPKVIFNQGASLTFWEWPDTVTPAQNPYLDPTVRAVIVMSDDTERYLRSAFRELAVLRAHHSIDPKLFVYQHDKSPQIAYMPRKNPNDARQVIELLKIRGALADWKLVAIDGMTERETAAVLRASAVFLSFGHPEGFGLPPAEAMCCGCIVVGYHGMGGREYFTPEYAFPIEFGDTLLYVETVENVLRSFRSDPTAIRGMAKRAADFIASEYSPQREEHDLLEIWRKIEPSLTDPGPDRRSSPASKEGS